jgi:hypothetical protein
MINLHRDQADIILKVFFHCKLLNLIDQFPAEFVGAKAGSLTHGF